MPSGLPLDALTGLFHGVPDLATPEQVQSSLRLIFADETIDLFWWDRESECYVDVRDAPVSLLDEPEAGAR